MRETFARYSPRESPLSLSLRGVFLSAALIAGQVNRAGEQVIGASGTLIVTIPSKGGLAVAADTRSHTMGVACDGNSKVSVAGTPPNTLVAGSGTSTWISARYPLWDHDPCGDLAKNGVVFFDAKQLTVSYLQEKNLPIWELDLKDLGNRLMSAVLAAHAREPAYVRSFAGKNMFQIVLAAYDPPTRTSFIRAIELEMTTDFKININPKVDEKYEPSSKPANWYFGDAGTYTDHVMNGIGKQFLPDAIDQFRTRATVADVADSEAEELAIGMVEAAKKTAERFVPALHSIGGPVEAYFIGPNGPRKLR
jgi:hypothetical protein